MEEGTRRTYEGSDESSCVGDGQLETCGGGSLVVRCRVVAEEVDRRQYLSCTATKGDRDVPEPDKDRRNGSVQSRGH